MEELNGAESGHIGCVWTWDLQVKKDKRGWKQAQRHLLMRLKLPSNCPCNCLSKNWNSMGFLCKWSCRCIQGVKCSNGGNASRFQTWIEGLAAVTWVVERRNASVGWTGLWWSSGSVWSRSSCSRTKELLLLPSQRDKDPAVGVTWKEDRKRTDTMIWAVQAVVMEVVVEANKCRWILLAGAASEIEYGNFLAWRIASAWDCKLLEKVSNAVAET